jgi:hypothetical protein
MRGQRRLKQHLFIIRRTVIALCSSALSLAMRMRQKTNSFADPMFCLFFADSSDCCNMHSDLSIKVRSSELITYSLSAEVMGAIHPLAFWSFVAPIGSLRHSCVT